MNIDPHKIDVLAGTPREYLNFDDPIAAYRGNVAIGALGPVRSKAQIQALLTNKPDYNPEERKLSEHLRVHAAMALRELVLPGIPHMAGVRELDLLMRQAYKYRNPLDPKYRRMIAADREALKDWRGIPERYASVPSLGAAAIGPPGVGKTITFDIGLRDMPRVVHHAYVINGVRVAFTQIPYLRLNLFQDGSLKSFGREIFEQAEESLSIPLIHEWGVDRATGNRIQSLYFQLCREYNVGLFVVDEFQLIQAVHDGALKALNYFVRMMNCIGVAVIVIGTPETANLLKTNLAASRRFLSSIPRYEPFVAGKVWNAFFAQIYRYLYVRDADPCEVLSPVVLQLSGGIPDLAIKLFLLAQMRLFGRKKERLTAEVLGQTSELLFYTVHDRLAELKGRAPEAKDIASLAKSVDESFDTLSKTEKERVGADTSEQSEPSAAGDSGDLDRSLAQKIREAANSDNPEAALDALGVLANP